jgi:PleD family two-component response regulator
MINSKKNDLDEFASHRYSAVGKNQAVALAHCDDCCSDCHGRSPTVESAHPWSILHRVKVLIVDDNRTNCRILQGLVERWGMKPAVASNGEQALLELAAARHAGDAYGLILTGMPMPRMDGFGLVENIRRLPSA